MNRSFEKIFVEQCAPTLAGIKPANLFRFHPEEREEIHDTLCHWNQQLRRKGIGVCLLQTCKQSNSHLLMAYRPEWILKVISKKETQDFLKQYGYAFCDDCESLWAHLSARLSEDDEFPHEVGVFLGYPLCDVMGFIQNRGKHYTCRGCWKAYGNSFLAEKQFCLLQTCTELYKRLYEHGIPILQLTTPAHIPYQ